MSNFCDFGTAATAAGASSFAPKSGETTTGPVSAFFGGGGFWPCRAPPTTTAHKEADPISGNRASHHVSRSHHTPAGATPTSGGGAVSRFSRRGGLDRPAPSGRPRLFTFTAFWRPESSVAESNSTFSPSTSLRKPSAIIADCKTRCKCYYVRGRRRSAQSSKPDGRKYLPSPRHS